MSEKFEIPIDYFIKNHNHVTRDLRPSDCAKCLIGELKQQLAESDVVISDFILEQDHSEFCKQNMSSGRSCCCMDRSYYNKVACLKRAREYKSKYKVGG